MSGLKKIVRAAREKLLLLIWDILERLPRLKNFVYKFYDRFWYLEKIIGSRNESILNIQNNKYTINFERLHLKDIDELNFRDKPIAVSIGKNGEFKLIEGISRDADMKNLNKSYIPIEVKTRHPDWIKFKRELLEYLSFHQDIYQPLLHPDLKTIKTSYTEERFKVIKEHVHTKTGTLLDIGSNFGFFCHKFEELGFDCYAVEIRPRNVYFMKRLRDIEGKHFKIINKSIFDITEKLDYDIILALNIFHHFLKDKGLFQNLIRFLKSINTKEMIFQPHNPKEKVMRNTYVNFFPQEFVELILKNSCLTKYELLVERVKGDNKDRPIYRLFR